jgi:hypothetical protein
MRQVYSPESEVVELSMSIETKPNWQAVLMREPVNMYIMLIM